MKGTHITNRHPGQSGRMMKKYLMIAAVALLLPSIAQANIQDMIASYATKYGVDAMLATMIISCESRGDPGAVHENHIGTTTEVWSRDIGYWQLNDYFQRSDAARAGFDIHDPEQNLEFGFLLLSKKGTDPWKASQKCWLGLSTPPYTHANANTI